VKDSTRTMAAVGVVAAGLNLAACSPGLVSSWTAPGAAPLQMSGSKVAAVVMTPEPSSRRAAEDYLAELLTQGGAQGIPMYTLVPDGEADDEEAARAAAEEAGIVGVVVMRSVRTDKEVVSTPTTYVGPAYGGYWGGYYGYGWGMTTGGDIRTDTIVFVETLVYSLRENRLVWAGQSKTTNPSSVDDLIEDTADQVADELEREGLLGS